MNRYLWLNFQNIQVTIKIAPEPLKVQIDSNYIICALVNLFTNSVQAMPNGGKIDFTATALDGKVKLNVHDTGNGMPVKVRDKIFKPLFTTKSTGQGFGLAVCKRLMEAQNSTITFTSQEGNGSTFTYNFQPHNNCRN